MGGIYKAHRRPECLHGAGLYQMGQSMLEETGLADLYVCLGHTIIPINALKLVRPPVHHVLKLP